MTYAFYWANQKIQRASDEIKGVPVYMLERVRTLDRVEESLRKELGEEPPKEHVLRVFMEKSGLSEKDVKSVVRTRTQLKVKSLDANTTDEDDGTLYNVIHDTSAGNPEKGNERIDLERRIKNAKLTERERRVIELRYFNDMTLEETSEEFTLTRERIRQIEMKALKKLRNVTEIKGGVRQRASEDEKDMDEEDAEEERADTRQPLEHITRLLENAGRLLAKEK